MICFRVGLVCLGVKSYYLVNSITQVIIVSYPIDDFLRHFSMVIPDFGCFSIFSLFQAFLMFSEFREFSLAFLFISTLVLFFSIL